MLLIRWPRSQLTCRLSTAHSVRRAEQPLIEESSRRVEMAVQADRNSAEPGTDTALALPAANRTARVHQPFTGQPGKAGGVLAERNGSTRNGCRTAPPNETRKGTPHTGKTGEDQAGTNENDATY